MTNCIWNKKASALFAKKPMQDSCGVVCTVDHAISLNMIANWDWDIEKACEVANAKCNLLAAHIQCNSAKGEADYEEFYEAVQRGEIVLGEIPELTAERIAKLKLEQSERARKASSYVSRETRVKAGRVGGRATKESTNGRKGHGDGNPARVRNLPRSIKEARRRGGLKVLVTRGHEYFAALGRRGQFISGHTKEFSRRGAAVLNAKLTPEQKAENGRKGAHIRNHVNRGIVNPTCTLCQPLNKFQA